MLVVELALLPEFIDSTHPAGDSTLVTTWDILLCLSGSARVQDRSFQFECHS